MKVISITPQFGVNYRPGYVGFTFTNGSEISEGIAYFERWSRLSDIEVSHALVVSGENECIEAHADEGVTRAPLDKYFNDPNTQIFFRQPFCWDETIGQAIVSAAAEKIGCKYDFQLLIADAMAATWLGHLVNSKTHNWPNRFVCWLLGNKKEFICSQLAAFALASQPRYREQGILRLPLNMITPQMLFEDEQIFEDWVNASGHGQEVNKL